MFRSQKSFRIVFVGTFWFAAAAFAAIVPWGGGFGLFGPSEAASHDDHSVTIGNAYSRPEAPATVFAANAATLGAIPDSDVTSPACQNDSTTFRDVTFSVSGLTGPVTSVAVNFNASHTYLQDLEVTLTAPSSQSLLLFSATGTTSTAANTCAGSSNDLSAANTYTFSDSASANWWTTAATNPVPTSTNSTVVTGIGGAPNPPATTSLNSAFATATANGTWTLRFRDRGAGDTGSVSAANLTIATGAVVVQHVLDFDGDGKTDPVVARNTGGGPSGQITWYVHKSMTNSDFAQPWGLASDQFMAGDFDGDHKSDITVWRPGTQAYFYIFQSATSTFRAVAFGQDGDQPDVIGDYTGDGKCDPAVYRAGATAGAQSFWYYLASSGPLSGQIVGTQWGQNGDFPAPGDYNGDGRSDFCVQRNAGGGSAAFYEHDGTGGGDVPGPTTVTFFGTPTDVIVPGDYDGDGKTDIATVRGVAGQIAWYYDPSSIPGVQAVTTLWGASATDYPTQGDFDGDGKTDVGVWRPNAAPGQTSFYYLGSTSGSTAYQYGQNGDYPVGNYNTH